MKIKGIDVPDILLHLLVLPLMPFCLILWLISWLFRQAVRIWLQNHLKERFGGLLCSADKLYVPSFPFSRKIILSVNYVRSDQKIDVGEEIRRSLESYIFKQPRSYPKLVSTVRTFLGQDYLLKDQIEIEDILKVIPLPKNGTKFDDDYLKQFVGQISNTPLPKNDTGLFEVWVSNQPVENMPSNVKGYVYVFVIRCHHVIADGIRLTAFFTSVFSSGIESNYSDRLSINNETASKGVLHQLINLVKIAVYSAHLVVVGPLNILKAQYFKEIDRNAVHGKKLSGEKLIAWRAEYDSRHVTTVKKIKNRIPKTRFTDVVFACVSASLFNHFKKIESSTPPERISSLIPILFFHKPADNSKIVELKNEFTFGLLDMPLIDPAHFMDGLERVKHSMNELRKSKDKDIIYWITNYISEVVPNQLIKFVTNTRAYTSIISCIPGVGLLKLWGDCELLSSISTAPNTNHTGVTLTIFTYDNKFHISLYVDKALISKQEDLQFIVDDILTNIDILDKTSQLET